MGNKKFEIIGYIMLFIAAMILSVVFGIDIGVVIAITEILITLSIIFIFFFKSEDDDRERS